MAVVQFENHVVVTRHKWASTVADALVANGGSEGDYALGDYPVGSTRDPETGAITVYAAPALSDAERAALIVLDRTDFLYALSQAVSQPFATVVSYVSGVIDAGSMDAADKDLAKGLLANAGRFHRVDPDLGASLLNAVGAELSLTPTQIDTLFLTAAGQA